MGFFSVRHEVVLNTGITDSKVIACDIKETRGYGLMIYLVLNFRTVSLLAVFYSSQLLNNPP